MTHNPFMARLIDKLAVKLKAFPEDPSVLEFGNQRFTAEGVVPAAVGTKTTVEFYQKLGFKRHVALDVNTEMGAEIFDLNYPLYDDLPQPPVLYDRYPTCNIRPPDYFKGFDLVTNNGTGEHVFNQATVFQNAHDFCRVGGIMVHVMPFTPWLNHGFYTFQPVLYRDLAAANDYNLVVLDIDTRDRGGHNSSKITDWCFIEKRPRELKEYVEYLQEGDRWQDVLIGVALRRTSDAAFKYPIQGKYRKDIGPDHLKEAYL